MKKQYRIPAACGLICDTCPWYKGEKETKCAGCLSVAGKPFWGECEVYKCALENDAEYCGKCSKFPCDRLINHYDPNNPKGRHEAIYRIGQLAIRVKIGTEKWLEKRKNGSIPDFES